MERPRDGREGVAGPLRVILVGKTGLDGALRRDPEIELIRCKTALEAVGELGSPIDDSSPGRAAVVVGPDASPREAVGDFIGALRELDPLATVLLVAESAHAPLAAGYDGILGADAGPVQLRGALVGAGRLTEEPPAPTRAEPERSERAGPVSVRPVSVRSSSVGPGSMPPESSVAGPVEAPLPRVDGGDLVLVQALLAGRDVAIPAMELIRARARGAEMVFIPSMVVGGQPAAPPAGAASVAHKDEVFGWLRGGVPESHLMALATWLAGWLALQSQQNALRTAAMVDDLTGAYNRRYFDRFMSSALEQALKTRHALTLLVFDIDDFKSFNDRYGHGAGDDILRETVRLLRSVIRPTDRVCRIGGDEFAVIFHEPTGPRDPGSKPPEDVTRIAQRFQQQIREHRFPKLGDCAPGTLTVSGGIATFPWDGRSVEELLEHADQLAMDSKRAGKNAIRIGPGTGPAPARS